MHRKPEKAPQQKKEKKETRTVDDLFGKAKNWYRGLGTKKPKVIIDEEYEKHARKSTRLRRSLFDKIQKARQTSSDKQKSRVAFAPILNFSFIKNLITKAQKDQKVIAQKTDVHQTLKKVRIREETIESLNLESKTPQTLLVKEARQIRKLIQKEEELRIYSPSSIGAIANITVRKTSLSLIESFPKLFKNLYNSLRLANIQILSNTYVNIMTFFTIIAMIFSFIISIIIYAVTGTSFLLLLINSLAIAFTAGILTFWAFYAYPGIRIKARRKSINANLSFAINHLSAVASSGVPPAAMFKLIAQSEEYEEVSVEINKVVDLIEVFGYDLTTAIKAVAATTPSPPLRDFFNGMINNLQSGGDLGNYLKQKADEATLTYQLERQKYTESISTYSDIYTGILIAAPLFFVSALSMVSMLGGKLAGANVTTVIGVGTYIVVPALNIIFLVFLELTQPEV